MKRLLIMRHAHAEPATGLTGDLERALTERGEHEAAAIGDRLAARGFTPHRMLASPALRARQTAELVARALGYPESRIELQPSLYLASADLLASTLESQPDEIESLLLVGHEPGLSELCRSLGEVRIDALLTAAVFAVDLEGDWRGLRAGGAGFAFFEAPGAR